MERVVINVRIGARRTSMRLSRAEAAALQAVCAAQGMTVDEFCTRAVADGGRRNNNTQKVRDAILDYLLDRWHRT